MKKVFSILAIAAIATSFVACGPSAEEKAKAEEAAKRAADSLAAALNSALTAAIDSAANAVTDSAATTAPATEEKK